MLPMERVVLEGNWGRRASLCFLADPGSIPLTLPPGSNAWFQRLIFSALSQIGRDQLAAVYFIPQKSAPHPCPGLVPAPWGPFSELLRCQRSWEQLLPAVPSPWHLSTLFSVFQYVSNQCYLLSLMVSVKITGISSVFLITVTDTESSNQTSQAMSNHHRLPYIQTEFFGLYGNIT